MFFGRPVTSKDPNILYNSYIKRTNIEFLNFIKNFYKKIHTKWFVKNKTTIFAVLITTLIIVVNCSMQTVTVTPPRYNGLSFIPAFTADSDTLRDKGAFYLLRPDTTVVDSTEDEVSTAEDIRNLVYEESGLRVPSSLPESHLWEMYNTALDNEIPITIWFRLIYTESVWNVHSRSHSGAQSYTQLMPSTYRLYRKKLNLKTSPSANIRIGGYYLKELYDYWKPKFGGDRQRWAMALASYKQGLSTKMSRRKKVPSGAERYVNWILKNGYE